MSAALRTVDHAQVAHAFAQQGIPALSFGVGGFNILSLHPANPIRNFAARDAEFAAISAQLGVDKTPENLVLLGDLNATPYCTGLKDVMRHLKLRNARAGRGLLGTYPVWLPTAALRIPIDHVLVGENIVVRRFSRMQLGEVNN